MTPDQADSHWQLKQKPYCKPSKNDKDEDEDEDEDQDNKDEDDDTASKKSIGSKQSSKGKDNKASKKARTKSGMETTAAQSQESTNPPKTWAQMKWYLSKRHPTRSLPIGSLQLNMKEAYLKMTTKQTEARVKVAADVQDMEAQIAQDQVTCSQITETCMAQAQVTAPSQILKPKSQSPVQLLGSLG